MKAPAYRRAQVYRALWWIVPLSTAAGLLPIVLAQPHGRNQRFRLQAGNGDRPGLDC
jgi:hypothetical protein